MEPKYKKYFKRNGFLSFTRKYQNEYRENLIHIATKTGIDDTKLLLK